MNELLNNTDQQMETENKANKYIKSISHRVAVKTLQDARVCMCLTGAGYWFESCIHKDGFQQCHMT